jgi:hypothetical protein
MAGHVVGGGQAAEFATGDYSQIFEWVSQLLKGPEGREKALLELSRKREQYDDLALILWHSFGMVPCPCALSFFTTSLLHAVLLASRFLSAVVAVEKWLSIPASLLFFLG